MAWRRRLAQGPFWLKARLRLSSYNRTAYAKKACHSYQPAELQTSQADRLWSATESVGESVWMCRRTARPPKREENHNGMLR